jgi:signal transduction histidine kinase
MQTAITPLLHQRTLGLLLLAFWAAAAGWSAHAEARWALGLLCLLLLGFAGALLERLRHCRLAVNAKNEEIEAARQALLEGEKMAILGRMVAGFAHEINTPIGVALGAISNGEYMLTTIERLIERDEVSETELRGALDTLKQGEALAMFNLRRAAALIQSFKRTAIDQSSDQQRVFVLRELIDDVLRGLQNQFKRLPLTLTVNCPNDLKIDGAPGLLEQLLTNLLINSVKHGFAGDQASGHIAISAQASDGHLVLEYGDNGVGMKPEVLARLFEPFFTTRRDAGGSGLGMAICYRIVTVNLGGTIDCQSKPGQGVKFLIKFPAQFVE